MISLVMTIIEVAVKWFSENYSLELSEYANGHGFSIKIKQRNKELTKW